MRPIKMEVISRIADDFSMTLFCRLLKIYLGVMNN